MEQPQFSQGLSRGTVGPESKGAPIWRQPIPPRAAGCRKGPLERRLALSAVTAALHPAFDVVAAADTLAAQAGGNRTALLRATARISGGRHGLEAHPGFIAERAAKALRYALELVEGRDAAEFLVRLQEEVLNTVASVYSPPGMATDDDEGRPPEGVGPSAAGRQSEDP